MSKFRPLLAATIEGEEQLDLLQYPLIASPKLDGIRVLIHPTEGPVTRSLKAVHNQHVFNTLNKDILDGLDGEIVVGENHGEGVFARTTSAVMSYDGKPEFTYWVFDDFTDPEKPYHVRLTKARLRIESLKYWDLPVKFLEQERPANPKEVLEYERECLERGFEGIMLRHTHGPYKFNRSTFSQQILLKLKRFEDAEATIIGFQELQRNQNAQTTDNLGLAERSSHKSGMVSAGTLGAIEVEHQVFGTFTIGSGFDAASRDTIWQNRDDYLGKTITFKYQKVGIVEKPRFPIFKGFREQE